MKFPLRLCAWLLAYPVALFAQSARSPATSPQPIPNAAILLRQVVAHQHQVNKLRENYTYRETEVIRRLNSHGHLESTKTLTYNVFFVHTHEIDVLTSKNGHPLSPRKRRKQQKRLQRAIALARKTPPGQSPGQPTVTISQLLAIMRLSHPRRILLDGRPTLVFHFTGRRHARAHGKAEKTLRKLTGSIWIDEKDREVRRLDAHFDANLHMGWGLVSVDKGSTFTFTQRPMHGGLWLPASTQIHLVAHALGFFGYRANIIITCSHYQVFHASAKQIPGAHVVPTAPQK